MAIKYEPRDGSKPQRENLKTKAAAEEALRRLPVIEPTGSVAVKVRMTIAEAKALDAARGLLSRQDWIRLRISGD